MEQRPREMSIRSDMRSPAANGSGEQWRSALQDATEQQQRAISRGQQAGIGLGVAKPDPNHWP